MVGCDLLLACRHSEIDHFLGDSSSLHLLLARNRQEFLERFWVFDTIKTGQDGEHKDVLSFWRVRPQAKEMAIRSCCQAVRKINECVEECIGSCFREDAVSIPLQYLELVIDSL